MQQELNPTLSIEVGAFSAEYSVAMSKISVDSYAFEANPHVYNKFKDQIKYVNYINKAVSNINGISQFGLIIGEDYSEIGHCGIKEFNNTNIEYEYIDVETVTLNDYFKDMKDEKISMWIDCEGANEEVLTGASELLSNVNSIFIETENKTMWKDQWLHNDVKDYLKQFDFEINTIKPASPNSVQNNVIFIKKDYSALVSGDRR